MAEAASGKEFECFVEINFGSLHSLGPKASLYDISVEHEGTTLNGTGTYYLNMYGNELTTAFDSKTARIDLPPVPRRITPRGQLKSMRTRAGFEGSGTANTNDFRIREMMLRYTINKKIGER